MYTDQVSAAACDRGIFWTRMPARSRRAGIDSPAIAIYATFAIMIAVPLALVLVQAVMPGLFDPKAPTFAFSAEPFRHAFASSRVAATIQNSLRLATAGAFTATLLGGLFALVVQRCELPFSRVIALTPWIAFLTPTYLKSLGWVLLMSPGGYLTQLGLVSRPIIDRFFTFPGLVFVETFTLFPLAVFIIGAALRGVGSELEDAARLAGAGPLRVWTRINLPLLAPAIALSLIAIFAEGLSDFGMAATIARSSRFDLLTYEIYAAASDYPVDFSLAGVQASILLMLVMTVVAADRFLRRQADLRIVSGRSKPPRRYELGIWRWAILAGACIVALFAVVLPLLAIALRALTSTLGGGLEWSNFTFENLSEVLTPGTAASGALGHSLFYAAAAAVVACGAALLLAVEVDRNPRIMRPLVLGVSLGAVAIPGIVLGFGYVLLWNRVPGFKDLPFPHYGSGSLLVLGYAAAALPYCLIVILAAVGQLSPSLGDAARLQGASRSRRLLQITLPLIFLSFVTAFLLTFIRTIFELPISQLLIPLSGPPVPPFVVRHFNHDGDAIASALSLYTMLVAGFGAGLLWFVAQRFAPGNHSTAAPIATNGLSA